MGLLGGGSDELAREVNPKLGEGRFMAHLYNAAETGGARLRRAVAEFEVFSLKFEAGAQSPVARLLSL
jgi:hypothetical protein